MIWAGEHVGGNLMIFYNLAFCVSHCFSKEIEEDFCRPDVHAAFHMEKKMQKEKHIKADSPEFNI